MFANLGIILASVNTTVPPAVIPVGKTKINRGTIVDIGLEPAVGRVEADQSYKRKTARNET